MTDLGYNQSCTTAAFEIDLACLRFEEMIGSGAFGRVVKARVTSCRVPQSMHKNMTVAVKFVKGESDVLTFISLDTLVLHYILGLCRICFRERA